MGKNFYIADLHLNHEQVLKNGYFHERPFVTLGEMQSTIRHRWNATVTNADTVYILGDIAYRSDPVVLAEYLSTLKGNLVLVRGNHDSVKDQRVKKQFLEICDYKELTDSVDGKAYSVVLSHYPIFSWKGMFRGAVHLYGHVHNNMDYALYRAALHASDDAFAGRDGERHKPFVAINVGCMMDYIDYTPRALKELLDWHNKKFYENFLEKYVNVNDESAILFKGFKGGSIP